MKKIFSIMLCVVLSFSMLATTAFAANGHWSMTISNNELKVDETFTVTMSVADFSRAAELVSLCYDKTALEVVQVADHKGRVNGVEGSKFSCSIVFDEEFTTAYSLTYGDNETIKENAPGLVENDNVSWSQASQDCREGAGRTTFAVVTFKALKAGTTKVTLVEDSYDVANAPDGYTGICQAETITVEGNEPVITVEDDTAAEVVDDAKIWDVSVDGGIVAAGGKLLATLTNTALSEDNTQEVTLNVGAAVTGEAGFDFKLKVRFKDTANRAAYQAATKLAVTVAN